MIDKNHFLLATILIFWCVLHSALISIRGVNIAKRFLKSFFRFYRLIYNSISVITLIPVFLIWRSIDRIPYFEWSGEYRLVQIALFLVALYLLYAGAKHYDGMQFLGLRQIFSKNHGITLSESGEFHSDGILNVVRHPWYTAGFLLLWARNVNSVSLIVNIIFSIYLVMGALLEERKLIREFGQAYIHYQKRVSMFFPWKWLKTQLIKNEFDRID